jgi:hypothetical protein
MTGLYGEYLSIDHFSLNKLSPAGQRLVQTTQNCAYQVTNSISFQNTISWTKKTCWSKSEWDSSVDLKTSGAIRASGGVIRYNYF